MASGEKRNNYNDLYFRIIISVVAAHVVISFGAKESFFQLLISWFYWRDLALSFAIAFAIISEVYLVTVRLDKKFDWKERTAQRIGLQAVLGLLVPAFTSFLLAAVYFWSFGYNILKTYYLTFDFPIILLLILILNLYYLAFYFYLQWQGMMDSTNNVQKTRRAFFVQKGTKSIALQLPTVAYFFHDGLYNFARTFEREDFMISQTLDEVYKQLPEREFFRVNRQMIVSFAACGHCEPLDFGKLELFVKPPAKEPIIISHKKVRLFKDWVER